jgi:hypothetical protein
MGDGEERRQFQRSVRVIDEARIGAHGLPQRLFNKPADKRHSGLFAAAGCMWPQKQSA